jgi:predicted outer membrane repeat protein
VYSSEFFDNHGVMGAIFISPDPSGESITSLEVTSTTFARNVASIGGAAIASRLDPMTLRNCTFYDNNALGNCGAVFTVGDLLAVDSLFHNNTAADRGGTIFAGQWSKLNISNATFADNGAHGAGGGAICTSSETTAVIVAARFKHNQAPTSAGGALLTVGAQLYLVSSNLPDNFAATNGGGVYSEEHTILYPSGASQFVTNVVQESGCAISLDVSELSTNDGSLVFEENQARRGGAVSATNKASVLVVSGCHTITFEMNWAQSTVIRGDLAGIDMNFPQL